MKRLGFLESLELSCCPCDTSNRGELPGLWPGVLGKPLCHPHFSEPLSPHPDQGQHRGLPALAMWLHPKCQVSWGCEYSSQEAFPASAPGGRFSLSWGLPKMSEGADRRITNAHSHSEAELCQGGQGTWCPLSAGTFSEPLPCCSFLLPK